MLPCNSKLFFFFFFQLQALKRLSAFDSSKFEPIRTPLESSNLALPTTTCVASSPATVRWAAWQPWREGTAETLCLPLSTTETTLGDEGRHLSGPTSTDRWKLATFRPSPSPFVRPISQSSSAESSTISGVTLILTLATTVLFIPCITPKYPFTYYCGRLCSPESTVPPISGVPQYIDYKSSVILNMDNVCIIGYMYIIHFVSCSPTYID